MDIKYFLILIPIIISGICLYEFGNFSIYFNFWLLGLAILMGIISIIGSIAILIDILK